MYFPHFFFESFWAFPKRKRSFLNHFAYAGWSLLALSILLGLTYSWLSVKWVKRAWGEKTVLQEHLLEFMMDSSFVLMMLSFIAGLVSTVWFFLTFHVSSKID